MLEKSERLFRMDSPEAPSTLATQDEDRQYNTIQKTKQMNNTDRNITPGLVVKTYWAPLYTNRNNIVKTSALPQTTEGTR